MQHSVDEPLVALVSRGTVTLMDTRAPYPASGRIDAQHRLTQVADVALNSQRLLMPEKRALAVYDRRQLSAPVTRYERKERIAHLRMHPASAGIAWMASASELFSSDQECWLQTLDALTGAPSNYKVPIAGPVKSLAVCGDFAIAVGENETKFLSAAESANAVLMSYKGSFLGCDLDYNRAVLTSPLQTLGSAVSTLKFVQW